MNKILSDEELEKLLGQLTCPDDRLKQSISNLFGEVMSDALKDIDINEIINDKTI